MLHLDIPTSDQVRRLSEMRADACVSIYLPTTPLTQNTDASRIELGSLLAAASRQLEDADFDKRRLSALRELVLDLVDDDEFWRFQAKSLAILATPDHIDTFRLPNALSAMVEVSQRFHLKPLLRAVTFPHTAFVLALSENGPRLLEIMPEGPPVEVRVAEFPRDAASAAGRASINDRSPSGRIQGSEGKKVRLAQYARKVDAALRPLLAGRHVPLFVAATEPLASIFHSVSGAVDLVGVTLAGSPDRTADADLSAVARVELDKLYAKRIADFAALYAVRANQGRASTDLTIVGRAAAYGAIDTILVDIDESVPGTFDDATGLITLADRPSSASYGVIDAIALRAMATGAIVLGVRKADIPGGRGLAAIMRYAI